MYCLCTLGICAAMNSFLCVWVFIAGLFTPKKYICFEKKKKKKKQEGTPHHLSQSDYKPKIIKKRGTYSQLRYRVELSRGKGTSAFCVRGVYS